MYRSRVMQEALSEVVHHAETSGRITCGVPLDRRDPRSTFWRDVTCRRCIETGFAEVRVGRWIVHAPEDKAESVRLVLEGAEALMARGRSARELRFPMRRLLIHHLEARTPDDPLVHGLNIRRFRARPGS